MANLRKLVSISGLRRLIHFSTAISRNPPPQTHFMVDYLINSLGFSRDEAISATTRLTHIKSTKNPDSVLNLFKQSGLDDTQIRYIVSSKPRLLTSNVEKTLKPKIRVFEDLGLTGSALGEIIVSDPSLFSRGLHTHLVPSIGFLRSVLGTEENVIKAIKKSKWLLSCNSQKRMRPNVLFLLRCGVSDQRIEKLILQNPRYLLQNPSWLEEIVGRVEGDFGISRDSWMFSYAIDAIASISKATLESKFRIFESFGWSKPEIVTMTRNLPFCLSLSEAKILRGLNFFMKELGYEPGYIASHPKLMMYSLDKRVMPRHAVLRALTEKKLIKTNPSLYSVVCLPETRFLNDFVLQHKDKVPDVYNSYMDCMEAGTRSRK